MILSFPGGAFSRERFISIIKDFRYLFLRSTIVFITAEYAITELITVLLIQQFQGVYVHRPIIEKFISSLNQDYNGRNFILLGRNFIVSFC